MSDKTYTDKENARQAVENALRSYQQAAEADGLDTTDMASEIEDACSEAGIRVDVLAN